jgi:hypothetical protein
MIQKLIKKICCGKSLKQLEEENKELKIKLEERQEVINQTNAYWKKKLYQSNKNNKKKPQNNL